MLLRQPVIYLFTEGISSVQPRFVHPVIVQLVNDSPYSSSNSLSLLPSEPKIMHGRDSEIAHILKAFIGDTPRIAILGAGGMGKTSLARAILHHSELTARYDQHRFFVACDSISTSLELAGLIGSHLGMKTGRDLTGPVLRHFSRGTPCLLILDNLETAWEPKDSREGTEKLLSLLTDIPHLALVVSLTSGVFLHRQTNLC